MPSLLLLSMLLGAAGIAFIFLARLLRSYPVVLFGLIFIVVGGTLCFTGEISQPLMGVLWIGFALIGVVFAGVWLYKNRRWAFWFAVGSDVALIVGAFFQYKFTERIKDFLDYESGTEEGAAILIKHKVDEAALLAERHDIIVQIIIHLAVPVIACIVVAVLGNLIFNVLVPRLQHRSKNEFKHRTNGDSLIGERVKIAKDKEPGRSQRGFVGDVDWAIEPLYAYEHFKVGDVVKVVTIKGVTLMCTRDGADYRKEIRDKREAEAQKRRIEDEKLRAKRAAARASRQLEAEKEKARREEERAKHAAEIRDLKLKAKEEEERAKDELRSVRENRKEAKLQREHDERMAELAAKQKLAEDAAKRKADEKAIRLANLAEARRKAQEEAEARRSAREAAKEAAKLERAKLAAAQGKKVKPEKEKPVKVRKEKPVKVRKEKPVKAAKKEAVVKECKCCSKHKFDLIYIIASACVILLSIAVIVVSLMKLFPKYIVVIHYVFFGLVLAYLALIFILEVIKQKEKEPKDEEPKAEPQPVEEEKAPEAEAAPAVEETEESKEKAEFVPFAVRMKNADEFVRAAYNELKSEVLSYGIKSRVSSTSDRFRLHKKEYVKMVIAGKYLKLYFALNPADYVDSTYPFEDASRMSAHEATPFVFKIKSGLSVRRAKVLIADVAKQDGLEQGEVVAHDHASELE